MLIFAQLAKDWAPSLAEPEMALLNRVSEEEPHDRATALPPLGAANLTRNADMATTRPPWPEGT